MIFGEVKLLAGLGAAAALLFAYQWKLHQAREEGRQECREAAIAEYKENVDELSRIASRARVDSARIASDAGAARAAADRLRGAVGGSGLVIRSTVAAGSAPLTDSELLQAELQRQRGILADRVAELAGFSDKRDSEQEVCEASYGAVSK